MRGERKHCVESEAENFWCVCKWKDCVVDFEERTVVVLGGLRRNQSGGRFGSRNFQVAVGEEFNKLRKVCILVSRKCFDVGTGIVDGEIVGV